jgi:DNA-binding CsgD family transcriptional regulator
MNLTLREFEVYMLIVTHAMCTREISEKLGITYWTAAKFQTRILKKMNMGSALELLVQYHRKEVA